MVVAVRLAIVIILGQINEMVADLRTDQGRSSSITNDLIDLLAKINRQCDNISQGKKDNYRPAFLAYVKSDPITLSGYAVFKFDDVEMNIGNHYNPSTGIFTASRSGLYALSCMINAYGRGDIHYQWMLNDSLLSKGYTPNSDFGTSSQSFVIKLKKGDHVYIKKRTEAKQNIHGGRFSFFSGYLLQDV